MDFEKLITFIFQKKSPSNLESLRKVLAYLGHVEKKYPIVHVAGTNGKGSVSLKIAKALYLSGYKVGLYSSPHIQNFEERISTNFIDISKEEAFQGLRTLLDLEKKMKIELNFFEITTLLAFLFFLEKKINIAVMEVGLGGRLDATNIIEPVLSVITSISFDHMAILGTSLEEIAREKAGIIKKNVPLILGPTANQKAILQKAKKSNAKTYLVESKEGFFDFENREIAKKAIEVLSFSFNIDQNKIKEALLFRPPCRYEKLTYKNVDIIFDVAHNFAGFQKLFEELKREYPLKKIHLIFSISQDKDQDAVMDLFNSKISFYLFSYPYPRLEKPEIIKNRLVKKGLLEVNVLTSLKEALNLALKNARDEGIICICGSFYFMGEAKELLSRSDDRLNKIKTS